MSFWWAEINQKLSNKKPGLEIGCVNKKIKLTNWGISQMELHKDSDFNPHFFSPEENRHWFKLLNQLRSFESAVCHTVRKLESKVGALEQVCPQCPSNWDNIALEEKVGTVNDMISQMSHNVGDQLLAIETDLDLAQAKITDLEISLNRIAPKIDELINGKEKFKKAEKALNDVQKRVKNMGEAIISLEDRVDNLENRKSSSSEGENGFISNGHGEIEESHIELYNPDEHCDVMVSDPFLNSSATLAPYDGNPTISFSRWAQRFRDLLSLYTHPLNEEQKISRLRFCLTGPARAELDGMDLPPVTLEAAIAHLQSKFENDNTKSIARQALTICRQFPGERVFDFATRLSEAVRTALAGETEAVIRKRLLEEFLDRLLPDLQYEVKSERPNEYSKAYELAQHYELLQASRKPAASISVGEITEKMESLAVQSYNNRKGGSQVRDRKVCFYCKNPGHLIRDCRIKKYDRDNDRNRSYRTPSRGRDGYRNYSRERSRYREERYRNPSRENYRDYGRNERNYGNGRNYGNERGRDKNDYGRDYNRYQHDSSHRSPSRDREWHGRENRISNSRRPSTPKVNFAEGNVASVRASSPYFFALVAILALITPCFGANLNNRPMICLPDAPVSLWRLPDEPICPNWYPTESPTPMELSIYRANTLQYKTKATSCKCVKTIIYRRLGLFVKKIENVETETYEIPTSTCYRMRDMNHSPAGEMVKNETFRFSNNSLEVGWTFWPVGIFWQTTEVLNCYTYDTVVFTRHGMEGINTPLGTCPGCQYKSGACRCNYGSLIWSPDPTQQCSYIWVAKWPGEYSTKVWLSGTNDFALTFENATVRNDCGNKEFMISDQNFAVPLEEYKEMIRRNELESKENKRMKRQLEQIAHDTTLSSSNSPVGLVYSSQLSAQLTALSAKLTHSTHRLFSEAIRQVCTSLQSIADQTSTLAIANPILLARYFLDNPLLSARLVTDKTLEIKPCFAVNIETVHYNWKKGFCFNRLPVTFNLYGSNKHGFLDTNTLIIYPEAKEIDCISGRWLYIQGERKLTQYDQISGDIKEIPREATYTIARYGNIDFPEMGLTIFKNKIMANLSELYSPEHFSETMEAAEIHQEIIRLTKPNGAWSENSGKSEFLAGNIVSNGLFSFLKGGIPSANQIWVFCVCCYVTANVAIQFLLPPFLAELARYLSLGNSIFTITQKIRKRRSERNQNQIEVADENALQLSSQNNVPLAQRWPSRDRISLPAAERPVYPAVNSMEVAEAYFYNANSCDENARIMGEINGKEVRLLIDTGAHISLCGAATSKYLDIRGIFKPEVNGIMGIGKGIVPALGQADVELVIADCRIKTPMLFIREHVSKCGSYDIIVGRKTLRQLPFLLDFETGQLISKKILKEISLADTPRNIPRPVVGTSKILKAMERVNTDLKGENLVSLLECLEGNKDVFSRHEYDLGECTIPAPPILTNTDIPVQNRPYRVPEKYQEELNKNLEEMLKAGVIEKSNTPWVSPIVIVQKSDGSLRPCVDFRALNKKTVTDPYPIPKMESVLHKVAGKKLYSTLDLASGFWQIPLDKETAYKCGIITEKGVFMMKKLPFGLKNSPSIFQRIMDEILSGILNVYAYIDDIIIFTDTMEEHLKVLELVFSKIRTYNLKFKPRKCIFCKTKIEYLGHILSENGYEPSLDNKETIENFPEPKNVKEVKRFLGMVGFFRKFIPNFAEKAAPMTLLLRGKDAEKKFKWELDQKKAFEILKSELVKSRCLRPPNHAKAFHLFTDASHIAWAAALMQADDDGNLYAVSFCSKTLNPTESRYPASHGELAAIVHAINVFRPIIYGSEIHIYTDHKPLTFLLSKGQINPKLNRWLLTFQDLNPTITYLEGGKNVVADCLSRVPIENGIKWEKLMEKYFREEIPYILPSESVYIDKGVIENETQKDETLKKVINCIRESWLEVPKGTEAFKNIQEDLYLDGKLIKKNPGQIVIPESLKLPILQNLHRAHFGITRTKRKARMYVWWPSISIDIEEYIKSCEICQRNSPLPPKSDPKSKWPLSKYCMERLHMDFAHLAGEEFLIVYDTYSKYPWITLMKSTNSAAVIAVLKEIFSMFGYPQTVVSDNGPQFTAIETQNFLKENGVKQLMSPPYCPSSNGSAEKMVQTFKRNMKKILEEQNGKNIKEALYIFLQEYRTFPSSVTEESPAQRMFRRAIRSPFDKILIKMDKENAAPKSRASGLSQGVMPKSYKQGEKVWVNINKKWEAAIIKTNKGEKIYEVELEGESSLGQGMGRQVHTDHIKARRISTRLLNRQLAEGQQSAEEENSL